MNLVLFSEGNFTNFLLCLFLLLFCIGDIKSLMLYFCYINIEVKLSRFAKYLYINNIGDVLLFVVIE